MSHPAILPGLGARTPTLLSNSARVPFARGSRKTPHSGEAARGVVDGGGRVRSKSERAQPGSVVSVARESESVSMLCKPQQGRVLRQRWLQGAVLGGALVLSITAECHPAAGSGPGHSPPRYQAHTQTSNKSDGAALGALLSRLPLGPHSPPLGLPWDPALFPQGHPGAL